MAIIEIKEPTPRDLKWFGPLFLLFFGIVGSLVWRAEMATVAYAIWGAAAVIVAVYYAVPALQRRFYLGWIYAVYPIGYVLSHVIMAVVYYGVVTPIGLILRLTGRDPLSRKMDKGAKTYWVEHRTAERTPSSYFRQF